MKQLRFIEILAWVVGSALVAIWGSYRLHAFLGSKADIQRFEQAKLEIPDQVDYSLWGEGRIVDYEASLAEEVGAPQAILRIPKLELEVAVLEGTDDLVLNRGVGRIDGTALVGQKGNLGIAGHRDGFFRSLKDVEAGDTMELETLTGTQKYVIDEISIVEPEAVEVLDPSAESKITLVTCYPFYFVGNAPLRYIVQATEVSGEGEIAEAASPATP